MSVKIKQKKYKSLPDGQHTAKIIAIEPDKGFYGPEVRFEFEIQYSDYAGQTLLAWAPATFSSRSKLYGWTRAALNAIIPKSYDFNSDDLLGRLVNITVLQKTKKDGTLCNRVESLLPIDSDNNLVSPQSMPEDYDDIPY